MLYAGDRNDAAKMIREWLDEGYAVIADRYLYSNIGFNAQNLKKQKTKNGWLPGLKSLNMSILAFLYRI
jgi:dTMP kinase